MLKCDQSALGRLWTWGGGGSGRLSDHAEVRATLWKKTQH